MLSFREMAVICLQGVHLEDLGQKYRHSSPNKSRTRLRRRPNLSASTRNSSRTAWSHFNGSKTLLRVAEAGDTTPCRMTEVTLHSHHTRGCIPSLCRMTEVTVHSQSLGLRGPETVGIQPCEVIPVIIHRLGIHPCEVIPVILHRLGIQPCVG